MGRLYYEEQIYHSYMWSEFKLAELTDICRVRPEEIEFTALLSRARRGYKHLTTRDVELLRSRECKNHNTSCRCFKDVMRIRRAGQSTHHSTCPNPIKTLLQCASFTTQEATDKVRKK